MSPDYVTIYDPDDPSGLDYPMQVERTRAAGTLAEALPRTIMEATEALTVFGPQPVGKAAEPQQLALPAITAAVPAALTAVAGAVPALAGVAGVAGAVYGGLQALGLGEGEGLFGLDVLGGDTQYVGGVPLGGPGLAEPPAEYLLKEWHVNYDWGRLQYYLVKMPGQSRKIFMYNTKTKRWKWWVWRTPHLAVIGKNMPSHKMITRLRRNLSRHTADARSILKITSPRSLKQARRRRR